MPSEKAIEIAAQCWCDPRTEDRTMDVELAMVFAEQLDKYIEALIWCSGSGDFGEGGIASVGWQKMVVEPGLIA